MVDLFGETTEPPREVKRKDPKPNGYAWQPGTGPEGETCGVAGRLKGKGRPAKMRIDPLAANRVGQNPRQNAN